MQAIVQESRVPATVIQFEGTENKATTRKIMAPAGGKSDPVLSGGWRPMAVAAAAPFSLAAVAAAVHEVAAVVTVVAVAADAAMAAVAAVAAVAVAVAEND